MENLPNQRKVRGRRRLLIMGVWSIGFCLVMAGFGIRLALIGRLGTNQAAGVLIVLFAIGGPGFLGATRLRLWLAPNRRLSRHTPKRGALLTAALLATVFGVGSLGGSLWLFTLGALASAALLAAVGVAGSALLIFLIRSSLTSSPTSPPP